MHIAKRAIIMAAGLGNRMHPVTDTMPKPLVPVFGTPMIETIIGALHQNHIFEIYIVIGYRGEAFSYLTEKFPGITLIENPDYLTANNISSLFYAREHLSDVVILDGDQLVRDPGILAPDFSRSCYCCIPVTAPTKEWVLTLSDHVVTHCSRTGGDAGWELHSVSFWSEADGNRLREHLYQEYVIKKNRDIYWDDVALFCHPEAYSLGIRPISRDSLIEIDSFEELKALDPAYEHFGEST